jgi:hypothetical protein
MAEKETTVIGLAGIVRELSAFSRHSPNHATIVGAIKSGGKAVISPPISSKARREATWQSM